MVKRRKPAYLIIDWIRETFELEVDEDVAIPFDELYREYTEWVRKEYDNYPQPRSKLERSFTVFGSGSDTRGGIYVRTNLRRKTSRTLKQMI